MASSVKPSPATKREEGLREWNGRRCPLSLCYLKWGDNSNDDYRHGLLYYSCSVVRPHRFLLTRRSYLCRGRILGRIPDKSLKSFPPCYSHSPLQLCLEFFISSNSRSLLRISSNSRNLLHISSNSCNLLCISTVQLLYTMKEKGVKPDRKPYPLPYV